MLKIFIVALLVTSFLGYLTERGQACFVHCFPSNCHTAWHTVGAQ